MTYRQFRHDSILSALFTNLQTLPSGGLLAVRIMVQQLHLPRCYRAVLPAWWTEGKKKGQTVQSTIQPTEKIKERDCVDEDSHSPPTLKPVL